MTFLEGRVALQLEAEERIGALLRQHARETRAAEDAAAGAVIAAMGGPA